jgi:hypothetical protein
MNAAPFSLIRSSLFGAVFAISLIFVIPAQAATAPTPSKSPALTAEQQKYKAALDKCRQRYTDEKIPRSQTHTFLSACMKDAGFKKAVHLPHPELSPPPSPPVKSK